MSTHQPVNAQMLGWLRQRFGRVIDALTIRKYPLLNCRYKNLVQLLPSIATLRGSRALDRDVDSQFRRR
jgi:hypothetical protein